jgi:hypothetical protein
MEMTLNEDKIQQIKKRKMKKIKLMHYQLDGEICVVDYNDLKVSYYGNNGFHYNLLGAVSDRIEAFLMRRKWNKISADKFAKLKLEIDEK